MILLALVVCHGVRGGEDQAQYAHVHPEELEANEVHEREEAPHHRGQVVYAPEHEGICCAHFSSGLWIIVALEDPLLLPELIDV